LTKTTDKSPTTSALNFERLTEQDMIRKSRLFYHALQTRRTVREFSSSSIPAAVIKQALLTAGTAPSGANRQPWHFAITTDVQVKATIRAAAEKEEQEFYSKRASQEWLDALAPLGTNQSKPFLDNAPVLIGVFSQKFSYAEDGSRLKNYYTYESVGIACGMLIAALHQAGLATLTHTPSPMKFLNTAFKRPATERPYLLLVVGYPADNCQVPAITRKALSDIASMVGDCTDDWNLERS
jgi:iodotyrosine deiodinase